MWGVVPNNVPNNAPMIFPNLLFICSFHLLIPYTLQNVPYECSQNLHVIQGERRFKKAMLKKKAMLRKARIQNERGV
jgi:hypothetical protein